jgi:hypothetical protein
VKYIKIIPLLFAMLVSHHTIFAQNASIIVEVVDDAGLKVPNAKATAGYATQIAPGDGWGSGAPQIVKGVTDSNGVCTLIGAGNGGEVGVSVQKDGYYSGSGYGIIFTNSIAGKWQPWNPVVDVVLKKVGNPIPMYAKRVQSVAIPEHNKNVGYDLLMGDLVAPYGRGEVNDIFFRFNRQNEREVMRYWGNQPRPQKLYDISLTISFPNEDDGIQPILIKSTGGQSNLRLPATAPVDGYVTNLIKRVTKEEDKPPFSNYEKDANYFFRIRTKKDELGNIVSALYGKIHGDIDGSFHHGKFNFVYYLNPTPSDRNVEFDPEQNLFKNLSSMEEVREP